MKKSFQKFVNANRFAIRSDAAENLASVFLDYSEAFRKDSGDINMKQVVERRDDGIAVIHIDGDLAFRNSIETYFLDQDTYQSIGEAFDECVNDESVLGILFEIDSPGGIVNGVSDLAAKIFGKRGSKPYGINAHTSGEMCSAAYWIGSSCEKVYSSDNASIGSIGVLCVFRKSDENKVNIIRSSLSPLKAPSPDNAQGRSQIEKELDDLASVFISTVAKNRGVGYETVLKDYGQGAVFVGENAVKAGLADEVMTLEDVVLKMKSNKNGGPMPNPVANNGANDVDVEALKKSAMQAERERIKGVNAAFAGLGLEKDAQSFIDEGKSVDEARCFAFDHMKTALENANKEIETLKAGKPNANNEQQEAIKLLEESSAKSKEIVGGEAGGSDPVDADIQRAIEAAAKVKGVR